MNKKTSLSIALSAVLGSSNIASADTIDMTFSGMFTLIGGTGLINANSDAIVTGVFDGSSGFDGAGSRTPVSGTATFDTATGSGRGTFDAFSFFGNGLASATNFSFQAIGDGMDGGPGSGSLVAATMGFNWNNNFGIPVTAIFDAAGFFGAIGTVGTSWTVGADCTGCATSATANTVFGHAVGAVPMAMTSFDTAGTTMGSLFPLSDTGGIAGSPMTTGPFIGQNMAFDFTTISTGWYPLPPVPEVPIPAAAWLFGSGLIGLVGLARRKKV